MSDPIKTFRKKRSTSNDYYYYKGHDGDSSGSMEKIRAKDSSDPAIGDRIVYRIINDGDTILPTFNSLNFDERKPLIIYDKNHPNFKPLNNLLDMVKNSRVLDKYGNYFDERNNIYNK